MNATTANFMKMNFSIWFALTCLIHSYFSLQGALPRRSILSKSKQYTISTTVIRPQSVPAKKPKPIPDRIYLSPYKLAHFAEAVNDQVLHRLNLSPRERWSGRIHLNIIPGKLGDPVVYKRSRFINRWQYRLDLPEVMTGPELARAIVSTQLEEYAARNSTNAPVMPAWLTEGFSEIMLQSAGPVLFLQFQNSAGGVLNFQLPNDPMQESRRIIQASRPVSFLDLSLPPVAMQTDTGHRLLRAHSHLLVSKLFTKPDGAKRMKYFLRELPKHKNNQHAFLTAFNHKSMLKAEQWWMLTQTQFRSRDAFNRWIPDIAMARLTDALQISVMHPTETGTTLQRGLISIQEFIKTGALEEHQAKVKSITQKLLMIQFNSPPEVARLVRDYRATLEFYLGNKTKLNLSRKPTAQKALLELTLQQLNKLDIIFSDLQIVQKTSEGSKKTNPTQASKR